VRITAYILVALAAYLLGSIPTGYLVARAKGVDIRTVGSGNIARPMYFASWANRRAFLCCSWML
jgi:glycerol-3-phosphate acyltransferase PlsY